MKRFFNFKTLSMCVIAICCILLGTMLTDANANGKMQAERIVEKTFKNAEKSNADNTIYACTNTAIKKKPRR